MRVGTATSICVALLMVAGACQSGEGLVSEPTTPPISDSASTLTAGNPGGPPPISVRGGGKEISLSASSFCWGGGCADGPAPESPPDIGSPGEIEVSFPATGVHFVATAVPFGEKCGRTQTFPLAMTGPTTHRLLPIGAAGDYVIGLFGKGTGSGPAGGDLYASFRWHTRSDGPNEAPSASVGIMVGDPPEVHSFGVILSLQGLRATPPQGRISATAVVTSQDGASMSIDLQRQNADCWPEGYVSFTAAKELGEQAALLGPAPFTYDIVLTMNATRYHATSTWPGDGKPQCSSCVVLHFSPPLPGL